MKNAAKSVHHVLKRRAATFAIVLALSGIPLSGALAAGTFDSGRIELRCVGKSCPLLASSEIPASETTEGVAPQLKKGRAHLVRRIFVYTWLPS